MGKKMSFPVDTPQEFVKWFITVVFIAIILQVMAYGGIEIFSHTANGEYIPLLILILIIAIMVILCLLYKKEKKEEKRVRKILKENSINLNERIINSVIYLNKDKKQFFCKIYNIPSVKNEDILRFIAENWVSSNDVHQDEMASLFLKFKIINGRYPEDRYYAALKGTLPKSYVSNVLERDNYICQICGRSLLTFEKEELNRNDAYISLIKPLSEGGTLTEDNLIAICKECREKEINEKKV